MAWKYRNLRISGAGALSSRIELNEPIIPQTFNINQTAAEDRTTYISGAFWNYSRVPLIITYTILGIISGSPTLYVGSGPMLTQYGESASVTLAGDGIMPYSSILMAGSDRAEYYAQITISPANSGHPNVTIAGGVWNGYLYEVV